MRTLDSSSIASRAAGLTISEEMLERAAPGLRGWRGRLFDARLSLGSGQRLSAREVFAEHLSHGDAGPALVVSTSPVRVAAYANELDAVIMLAFPDSLASALDWAEGERLVCVCTYAPREAMEGRYAQDIIPGKMSSGHFGDAAPLIGEVLSGDSARLQLIRGSIPEDEWDHVASLARSYQEYYGERARDGDPVAVCFG